MYTGTITVCRAAMLSKLLMDSGAPARSMMTLTTTATAATINGHFRIPVLDCIPLSRAVQARQRRAGIATRQQAWSGRFEDVDGIDLWIDKNSEKAVLHLFP